MRPATRVGRHLLLPDGRIERLTRFEHLLFALGLRKSIHTSTTTGRRSL